MREIQAEDRAENFTLGRVWDVFGIGRIGMPWRDRVGELGSTSCLAAMTSCHMAPTVFICYRFSIFFFGDMDAAFNATQCWMLEVLVIMRVHKKHELWNNDRKGLDF